MTDYLRSAERILGMSPKIDETLTLPLALKKLAETEDMGALLDVDCLPAEERETARLFNRVLRERAGGISEDTGHMAAALNAILNSLDAIIMVTVPETGEILFMNDRNKERFGLRGSAVGQRCYKLLHGNEARCGSCAYLRLKEEPGKVVRWESEHPDGKIYRMAAMLVEWPGGGKAHVEFGEEIAGEVLHRVEMQKILNGMEALITVADFETHELLFLNDSIRRYFGITDDWLGKPCYKVLQGLDEPCASCPHEQLKEQPDKTIIWEHREAVKGRVLHKTASCIDWIGGKKAHLEYAIDITETRKLEKNVTELESEVVKLYYDPLTGIYSRRFFEETIKQLLLSLNHSYGILSMMMVDIDYFKQYNDTYGHMKGDDCLKAVAQTLRACLVRRGDFVARYGGEEFVVVLPNTDEDGARVIADRMLNEMRNCNIPHETSTVADCVTISIGAVTGTVLQTRNRDDYLVRADEMLYASKQGGRDRFNHICL